MDASGIGILAAMAGFLLGALAVGLYCGRRILRLSQDNAKLAAEIEAQETARQEMEGHFKLTAQEALKNAHESFLQLAESRLKDAQKDTAHDLDKRQKAIDDLVKPVHQQLESLGKAMEQAKGTDQALREDLKNLHKETAKLAGALRNPAARGNWGEGILERLLENSGLMKGVHYTMQETLHGEGGHLRPDAIINMPDSLHIVIDAKAPINDFIRHLDEDMNESDYKNLQIGLAQAVKAHIQQLSKKAYWEQLNSPDFVVLFLPSEHLFSAAVQADPMLLDLAAEKKIVMASPILTMSLLRVVGMSWRQVELAKNAAEIAEHGTDLYKRLLKFTDHVGKIGKHLQTAMRGYDDAVGSLERSVMPAARKFKDLQCGAETAQSQALPEFKTIEESPRIVNLTGEDEQEKKRA